MFNNFKNLFKKEFKLCSNNAHNMYVLCALNI